MNTIINTAMIISLTVVVFSILLTISNRYISNHGKCQITINDDTKITVNTDETLYECLDQHGIQIPVLCGGKGTCGSCKVKVNNLSSPLLPIEEINLSEDDKLNNYRLACQYRVAESISVEIPEAYLSSRVYDCTVHRIEKISDDIKLLQLNLPKGNIEFKPGQYIKFYCPIYKNNATKSRSDFTIAKFEPNNKHLSLYVKLVTDSGSDDYIHHYLQQDSKVTIAGPYTYFDYQDSKNPILLICNDDGYGHVSSVLEFVSKNNASREVSIVYLCTQETHILCQKIRASFSDLNLNVNTVDYNNKELSNIMTYVDKSKDVDFYLCANKTLNKEIKKQLLINKVPNRNIFNFNT